MRFKTIDKIFASPCVVFVLWSLLGGHIGVMFELSFQKYAAVLSILPQILATISLSLWGLYYVWRIKE